MRRTVGPIIFLALIFLHPVLGATDTATFDGVWNTTLSCSTTAGALGYSYQFPSTVKGGVLHGERGAEGQPGWLRLDGTIQPDGRAKIHAKGLVGEQKSALGQEPAGTPYAYRIEGKFTATEGTGKRVKSRACEITFVKSR
jgi:hypothetical protein